MNKPTKVSVSHGLMSKEFCCDLFVGLAITGRSEGHACDYLIAGMTNYDGIARAISMLKKLEDQLYDLLPIPREIAQLILSIDDSIRDGEKGDGK